VTRLNALYRQYTEPLNVAMEGMKQKKKSKNHAKRPEGLIRAI